MAMNLHAIAAPFVAIVSGATAGFWRAAYSYETLASGKRVPLYGTDVPIDLRVQSLSGRELALMDGLNIQGIMRAVYAPGDIQGADRKDGKGGDLLIFDGDTWLVATVLETWTASDWCKVVAVKQVDP